MDHRMCRCGAAFAPAVWNQKHCSRRCNKRASREAEALRWWMRSCAHCCRIFMFQARLPKKRRYCSDGCHRDAKRAKRTRPLPAPRRWRMATRRLASAAEGSQGSATWVSGPCASCGIVFTFNQPQARVCSAICGRRISRQTYRAKHGRMDNHRHRARVVGVEYEPISKARVFKRDGWRCGICGKPTKRSAKVPEPMAPTLDHIIPMNKINLGPHLYSNVQCAHFECNWRKGAGGTDQLRLIG